MLLIRINLPKDIALNTLRLKINSKSPNQKPKIIPPIIILENIDSIFIGVFGSIGFKELGLPANLKKKNTPKAIIHVKTNGMK